MTWLIQTRFDDIQDRIKTACFKSGRKVEDVTLVVVTKGQPAEKIIEIVNCGATVLGENYPEETIQKINEINGKVNPEWHMIGHLQSRKIKLMHPTFSLIHSVDSVELARKLDNYYSGKNQFCNILLEVNIAGEQTKFGFDASSFSSRNVLLKDIEELSILNNIKICGLMTMPPFANEEQENKKFFDQCREFRDLLVSKLSLPECNFLSMGTSADFESAIECGATHVRIGEAIMGKRIYKNQ